MSLFVRLLHAGRRRRHRSRTFFHVCNAAAAYAFLVFVLLYIPCIAAMATLYREMGGLKWTLRSILWQLGAAYLGSFLAYHIYLLVF